MPLVKIDLTKSQANMTADCKSDSVPIPPRIYSRFTEYRLFKYSKLPHTP